MNPFHVLLDVTIGGETKQVTEDFSKHFKQLWISRALNPAYWSLCRKLKEWVVKNGSVSKKKVQEMEKETIEYMSNGGLFDLVDDPKSNKKTIAPLEQWVIISEPYSDLDIAGSDNNDHNNNNNNNNNNNDNNNDDDGDDSDNNDENDSDNEDNDDGDESSDEQDDPDDSDYSQPKSKAKSKSKKKRKHQNEDDDDDANNDADNDTDDDLVVTTSNARGKAKKPKGKNQGT